MIFGVEPKKYTLWFSYGCWLSPAAPNTKNMSNMCPLFPVAPWRQGSVSALLSWAAMAITGIDFVQVFSIYKTIDGPPYRHRSHISADTEK